MFANQLIKDSSKVHFTLNKQWLGAIDFEKSLETQEKLKSSASEGQFSFLGFEPLKPIITKGLRSTDEDILWSPDELKENSISQIELRRGGQVTLHPPGQLVIYPVFSLPLLGLKVRDYILSLEKITQSFLKDLGIDSKSLEEFSGLSTKKGKIAFFGIHISQSVSQHGLSINVCNNLNLFSSIKSCGLESRPHDKLSFYDIHQPMEKLFDMWVEKAKKFYGI